MFALSNVFAPRKVRSRPSPVAVGQSKKKDRASSPRFKVLQALPDDLSREVYCVLGLPLDAIDMASVLGRIDAAGACRKPYFISTANLNFLITSLREPHFAKSLHASDLCTADGMPIVWIARLLGVPVRQRVAGSDVLERLSRRTAAAPLKVYFFGGEEGAGEAACVALNASGGGLIGAGSMYPGYATVEDLSKDQFIAAINASKADFLVTALGASKGQAWLLRNHHRLTVPVRAHLGAAINFQAGTVRRAPRVVQKLGLEWLWRIKEEPALYKRYWRDGCGLLHVMFTRVLPLAISQKQYLRGSSRRREGLEADVSIGLQAVAVHLAGCAVERNIDRAVASFRASLMTNAPAINLDLSGVDAIDARFLGLLLMLRKTAVERGKRLNFLRVSPVVARFIHRNELGFLLSGSEPGQC